MKYSSDLTGTKFGFLTVVKFAGRSDGRQSRWECLCDCGKTTIVIRSNLVSNQIISCGCNRIRQTILRSLTHGHRRHYGRTPIYNSWAGMIQRCTNKHSGQYKDYGGRGITVCKRWATFANFLTDMGSSWRSGLSIDRINNDGNYEPGNCKWSTKIEQNNNRRESHVVRHRDSCGRYI